MTKKKKKVPCFTEDTAKKMGVSQKTIQNYIRIADAIKSGLFPPEMVEDFENERQLVS